MMNSNESKKSRSSGNPNGGDIAAESQIIIMANNQNPPRLAYEVQRSSSEESPVYFAMMDPRDSQPRNHKQRQKRPGGHQNNHHATDKPPSPPHAFTDAAVASRASSRPVVAHRTEPTASLNGGIPSAIDGPSSAARLPSAQQVHSQQVQLQRYRGTTAPGVFNHYALRLPPSDEQAVLQRIPRTHATVVAHDLPPPPTSSCSDVWSSTSGSGGSALSKRSRRSQGWPMVASVRLANGGTVDSVNMSNGASPSPSLGEHMNCKPRAVAMHVTMDDPILRKKIMLKHHHQRVFESGKPSPEALVAENASKASIKGGAGSNNGYNNASLKRKISAISAARGGRTTSDDYSDSAKGSGSDGGYAASSEHQSGSSGSGSDSMFTPQHRVQSSSSAQHHHHYHSRSTGRKMLEKSFLSAKRDFLSTADAASAPASVTSSMPSSIVSKQGGMNFGAGKSTGDHSSIMNNKDGSFREASIYSLGQDVMAQVMLFL
eukprot:CAMPEP_0201905888 /NCGR_PEP_ID=MMETSP0902-20130614/56740_1 /ASSEMBLY_ACC=CAM_ASM_000551 /TAXON_ID=420261 /ORGANISM="Thalassiosira antarctica, Strain CCMP982" /LENGTH=487 /DNA_ID=CAMNT_0048440011 /DNA_START=42 /DNA_END=1501 /DNA_ORIENTATION=-